MPRIKTETAPLPQVQQAPAANLPAVSTPPQQAPALRSAPFYPVKVLKALNALMAHINLVDKAGVNKFHNYKYARIEDVIAPVRDEMVRQGLILIQSETSKRIEGGLLLIEYEFTWVHVDGDAMPPIVMSGACRLVDQKGVPDDKAVPKAHSQAEKYFLIKQLRIKVSDTPDSDADGPHVPQAGPNVIAGGRVEPRHGDRQPAADQRAPGPHQGGGRGTQQLDIAGIAALEKEAREAASKGSEVMAAFWRSLLTRQQQNVVMGLMSELKELRANADQQISEEQAVDPETGEVIQG